MLRFAISPTRDMYLSDLRIALFNYLLSIQKNESFIVRFEDTDTAHNIEGKENEFLDILGLFGITSEQHINQSAHLKYHRSMALQLLNDKRAFNCFCTDQQLEKSKDAAKKANKKYTYSGACTHLSADQTIDNFNPFSVRLRKPVDTIVVKDALQGELQFSPDDIDSFVIMHRDKSATHDFATAVDDMISDISLVVKSQNSMLSTPKQIAIRSALGYTKEIQYIHVPPLLDSTTHSDDKTTVKSLLEKGFLPQAIVIYLISLGNTVPKESFSITEAATWFTFEKMLHGASVFNLQKLEEINQKQLLELDDIELSRYVGFADADIGKLAKLFLEDVTTLEALRPKIKAVFDTKTIPPAFEHEANTLRELITKAPYFETYEAFESYLLKETQFDTKVLKDVLSLLLSGTPTGPDISKLYVHVKNYLGEIIK